jgi:hypothetical protein
MGTLNVQTSFIIIRALLLIRIKAVSATITATTTTENKKRNSMSMKKIGVKYVTIFEAKDKMQNAGI